MFLPGEERAIKAVCDLGKEYGYGNLMYHMKNAWSKSLQAQGIPADSADMAAGHICPWCRVDSRYGKKSKNK